MTSAVAPLSPLDVRAAKRTNIFLGATLRFEGRSAPVRVRDLSSHGAQIEGAVLPAQDISATLERGSVFAECVVAWRSVGRCGLRFTVPLAMSAWRPGREVPRTQSDVDWTVAEIRAEMAARQSTSPGTATGLWTDATAQCPPGAPSPADLAAVLPARLAEELGCVVRMLRSLNEELGHEGLIAARYGPKLKLLDQSSQLLEQVAVLIQATDPLEAIECLIDESLRRRLKRGAL